MSTGSATVHASPTSTPGALPIPTFEPSPRGASAERVACFHCGEPCRNHDIAEGSKFFCCQGCLLVHDLLAENGMESFYELTNYPGAKVREGAAKANELAYLDDPKLQRQLLDFTDGASSRITLHIPAIHCVACVWLLENLFRLKPGVGRSTVNFGRRELSLWYEPERVRLSEVVAFLTSLGYEPALTFDRAEKQSVDPARKKLWLRVGIAGFAFGNIMLFSLPGYLGLDSASGPVFRKVFGVLSLLLALPVVVFSAGDYWRSAFLSLKRRVLTLDVPIALGLAALYLQSAGEILMQHGEGYLDSLAALVFFLLCGRVFQQKTFERIAFDRDYRCFFPLRAVRKTQAGEESVALSDLQVGDRLVIRNGELIPADARLTAGDASIDYSFVTGESDPVNKLPGDYLYCGGKHYGGMIEVEVLKPVSQSYLTSLWNDEVFRKPADHTLDSITNQYSRRFTWIVLAIALGAVAFWVGTGQPVIALKAFTSVLIVACPCALALAAPFTLGAAQRALARVSIFVKGPSVIEQLAEVRTAVFDKTGTLTNPEGSVRLRNIPDAKPDLAEDERQWLGALASYSNHPYSRAIAGHLSTENTGLSLADFEEQPGLGTAASTAGHRLRLGSREWMRLAGIESREPICNEGAAVVYAAIDGRLRGCFQVSSALRPDVARLLSDLSRNSETILLSGDTERERETLQGLFGDRSRLHFNQSPADKLGFVRQLQAGGAKVMMVGDGLNDAGALKQSDVGVAVVERTGAFSPASDMVLPASEVKRLGSVMTFARASVRIVRLSFIISAVYNAIGISIAAAGVLSPLICAVLMPVSSVSVVLFAMGSTNRAARKHGLWQPS